MELVKSFIKEGISLAAKSSVVSRIAEFIVASNPEAHDSYAYLRKKFINNGRGHSIQESIRAEIVERFERIDREVPIGTTPSDGLFLAEMLLNITADGAVVECGCYAGGSSAKLSILASLLNRDMIICDSFEGLPEVNSYNLRDAHCRRSSEWVTDWDKGRYAARLDAVKAVVTRYNDSARCKFVKGWFSDTLTDENLPENVAFAFADVDIASSARDCFVALWPRLSNQGVYVTHDTAYIKVLQEFFNPDLWLSQFKTIPPIMFGAGYGLCNGSPHLGYMVKGTVSAEYLKSLTIDK